MLRTSSEDRVEAGKYTRKGQEKIELKLRLGTLLTNKRAQTYLSENLGHNLYAMNPLPFILFNWVQLLLMS